MADANLERSEQGLTLAAWALFAATAIAIYVRIHFGVDFTDESFYVSLPWAFTIGHRPFADEIAIHQLGGLLLVPVAWIHQLVAESPNGIMFFFRQTYFVATLATAMLAARTLAAHGVRHVGILTGATVLAYIPFAIPSLSYNSIAQLALLAGLLVLYGRLDTTRAGARLFWGTFLLGAGTFAYPTILVATVPGVLLSGFVWRHARADFRWIEWALPVAAAASLWAAFSGWILWSFGGMASVARLVALNEAIDAQGGGREKLAHLYLQFRVIAGYLLGLLGVLAAATIALRAPLSPTLRAGLLLLAGPALAWVAQWPTILAEPRTATPFVLSLLGVAAVPILLSSPLRKHRPALLGHTAIASFSLVAGLAILWSTANGMRNLALGLMPAALVGLAALGRNAAGTAAEPRSRWPAFAFLSSVLAFFVHQTVTHTYHEAPIFELSHRVEQGAWAGMRTTPERAQFIQQIADDLDRMRPDAESILFFDYFPAGYLFSDIRPNTPALWMFPANPMHQANPRVRPIYDAHFDHVAALPDVVFRMKAVPMSWRKRIRPVGHDPILDRFGPPRYRVVTDRADYAVLVRTRGEAASAKPARPSGVQ